MALPLKAETFHLLAAVTTTEAAASFIKAEQRQPREEETQDSLVCYATQIVEAGWCSRKTCRLL